MAATSFPLVRGRIMRVTRTDGCCAPAVGEDNQVVTEGFVSVALTATINEPEEILITNANGKTCVRDPGCPEFQGYGVEITFCEVTPCLFSIVTGQPSVLDADGEVVGFRMNSGVSVCDTGFALEVWMGVPGVACTGDEGAFGYLLLPCLQGGVIGDFSIENAAITFTVTGAVTKDGNGWGTGPYEVVGDADGDPAALPSPLEPDDHLYAVYTTIPPPEPTDGCVALVALTPPTGVTPGEPGSFTPPGSALPANLAALQALGALGETTAWTTDQHVILGDTSHAHWDGDSWAVGDAP